MIGSFRPSDFETFSAKFLLAKYVLIPIQFYLRFQTTIKILNSKYSHYFK